MKPWTLEHGMSFILTNMALFNLKLIQEELIFLLDHKIVFVIIRIIFQNPKK